MKRLSLETISKKYSGLLTDEQFDKVEDVLLGIKKTFSFSDNEIEELDQKLKARNDFNNLLSKTAQRNNNGIEHEKNGKIEEAINVYEENIIDGYPASHSFNRLMILYHKQKQYKEEIRVIKRAIEIFSTKDNYVDYVNKWKSRLIKLEGKMD